MHTIEIDDDVYRLLERHVLGFKDVPNMVLRRILGIDKPLPVDQPNLKQRAPKKNSRQRAPNANLRELINAGYLSNGQILFMHDYSGNRVQGVSAMVRPDGLEHNGRVQTMSALTKKLMRARGFESESYRGPQFWFTEDGRSIKDLWDRYLNNPDDEDAFVEAASIQEKSVKKTWCDWIVDAFRELGGTATYHQLYEKIRQIRPGPFTSEWKATVRRTIETYSSDSENYSPANPDLFRSIDRLGNGHWGLRVTKQADAYE